MAEKTEQPTPKRIRDARNKGQVCKSQDIPSASIITFVFIYICLLFTTMREKVEWMFRSSFDVITNPDFDSGLAIMQVVGLNVFIVAGMILPVLTGFVGLVANMCQVGFLAAFESVIPKLDKLNPANWFKNVFSMKNLLEFIKGVVKMFAICYLFYSAVKSHIGEITTMPIAGFDAVFSVTGYVLWDICKYLIALFIAIAVIDYVLQNHIYMKGMMMSMEEIKNEYKESEGDPTVKGQRKQLHQEIIFGEDEQRVQESSVVVTNPSHYAVAIRYVKGETQLPIVMMKGMDGAAVRIMRMAEKHGVPIFRNVPLARSLFALGNEMEYIPSELIEPVAEVLRWLREEYPLKAEAVSARVGE